MARHLDKCCSSFNSPPASAGERLIENPVSFFKPLCSSQNPNFSIPKLCHIREKNGCFFLSFQFLTLSFCHYIFTAMFDIYSRAVVVSGGCSTTHTESESMDLFLYTCVDTRSGVCQKFTSSTIGISFHLYLVFVSRVYL
ncbi:hypothetical protein M430DRAFT_239610 [Amorphotheca resinae ATCC 22711]|uniref:Uncharacterized protein n=1 Tax=Amorphotheca resinae ATCC 22711 TaxID=857342 RepID=A0A2T3B1K5_AMORE|nr:hypothetical protein M430DRAFT_239610 [Amorphotheca resinae ATCC 22711]PSS18454.1 hypothetical protein M430DRAFT_239610 [Amorphotheca resinae ATCC 22711]